MRWTNTFWQTKLLQLIAKYFSVYIVLGCAAENETQGSNACFDVTSFWRINQTNIYHVFHNFINVNLISALKSWYIWPISFLVMLHCISNSIMSVMKIQKIDSPNFASAVSFATFSYWKKQDWLMYMWTYVMFMDYYIIYSCQYHIDSTTLQI